MNNFSEIAQFIWKNANLLRGPYKKSEYGDVVLPLTVLRRLECVLDDTREKVLAKAIELKNSPESLRDAVLEDITGCRFYNSSPYTLKILLGDPDNIAKNLVHYIQSFSPHARRIMEYFRFEQQIHRMDEKNCLFLVIQQFADIDLHPNVVSGMGMGYIFEELVRIDGEMANEEAGDHFTPREVIRLLSRLIFEPDRDELSKPGITKTLYDPACGTGGMLSVSEELLHELNPQSRLVVFGQEYNDETYAVCGSDLLIKGQDLNHLIFGDTFLADGLPGDRFDYMLANPPFGVEWKTQQDAILKEKEKGYAGRFGAGLPRISDGALLFLQHMISKMKPVSEGGSRIGIVFNGSPLFTGDAGSGESEIRRWIIESDWLETIVGLPDQLFYNTGISTYLWIVTNRKTPKRRGKVQLIQAADCFVKMRKSLGKKRNEISLDQIDAIVNIYRGFADTPDDPCADPTALCHPQSRIFPNDYFGYTQITVERPLRCSCDQSLLPADDLPGAADSTNDKRLTREEMENLITRMALKAGRKLTAAQKKKLLSVCAIRDESAKILRDAKGNPEPDAELRDRENVPLLEDIHEFFTREVLPHAPDAWIDESVTKQGESKSKVGYEINLNRVFYRYMPPRPLEDIEEEIRALEAEIFSMVYGEKP